MPIVNGAYDAPTWNNNAPPAIDASELQDMCDTIETYNTQKADVDYVNTFVRPNLLDNAYFVGGGSQQGGGQFPINQRGATSYTGEVYGIDRWKGRISTQTVSLQSGCLRMGVTSTYQADLHQMVESMATLVGETLTFTALVRSDGTAQPSIGWQNTTDQGIKYGSTSTEWQLLTTTISPTMSNAYPRVYFTSTSGHYVEILAMKLEIGSTQTLAHQENGVWVLNEIPNYQQELAKCQRYVLAISLSTAPFFVGTTGNGSTTPSFFVPTPVTMRANPTITGLDSVNVQFAGGYKNNVSLTGVSGYAHMDGVRISATANAAITSNAFEIASFSNRANILLSADL